MDKLPVQAYRDACNTLLDIQDFYEEPGYRKRIRAHTQIRSRRFTIQPRPTNGTVSLPSTRKGPMDAPSSPLPASTLKAPAFPAT